MDVPYGHDVIVTKVVEELRVGVPPAHGYEICVIPVYFESVGAFEAS